MRELLFEKIPNLTGEQCDKFVAYIRLLIEWNQKINLTAITEPEAIATKHFLDSLAALPYLKEGATVVDVGTGAGFPGVPLLITRPDLQLTLMDSLQKRVKFLETLCAELGLAATCLHLRAEDMGRDAKYRERFDAALTRAVAPLPVLLELTLPLVRVGGQSICYKGETFAELPLAQNAAFILGGTLSQVAVPADYGVRNLIICTKKTPTPSAYPRKAGLPAKKPL
ncbi:MAG: 16S rRNA (guanine(527)-N(7))-methyltransferase RsmG [Clostridiales bacterium]|nr:16S rRNA (guanine(527)-N(7))-methyltransferase RsmG [Clostridiales bacterium]